MTDECATPEQVLPRLVADAKEFAERERRTDARFPFFRHTSVHVNGQCHSAYTRNISESGIGLMHAMNLPLCDAELCISTDPGVYLKLRARIEQLRRMQRRFVRQRLDVSAAIVISRHCDADSVGAAARP